MDMLEAVWEKVAVEFIRILWQRCCTDVDDKCLECVPDAKDGKEPEDCVESDDQVSERRKQRDTIRSLIG